MKKLTALLIFLSAFFVFAVPAFADVEYAIKDVQIDAFLKENGDVEVTERFTYDFEDDFNGITRTIIPKKGTSITDFEASEDGNALRVENDDNEYKIYRKGNQETITVDLRYTIHNGIEVYPDVAQFYWPFFDSSNESVYENMTIYVHPTSETGNVIAYGYDEAYDTAEVTEEGVAVFSLGHVDDDKNGDIQVVYDATLFSAAPLTSDNMMRDSIEADIADNEAKLAAFQDRKEWLASIAPYVVGIFGIYFIILLFIGWRKKLERKHYVQSRLINDLKVPKLEMSLPATILYTNPFTPSQQLLTTSLLELVRKGYVQSDDNKAFELVNRLTAFKHERMLLEFLFDTIGDGTTFRFEDLKTYTDNKKNHQAYHEYIQAWLQAIREEIQLKQLTQTKAGFRWTIAFSGLLLIPLSVFFGIHELLMWMFISIVLLICLLAFSIFYNPRTLEGAVIWEQWKQFKKDFTELSSNQSAKWSKEEQIIAINYVHGIADKRMIEHNKTLFYHEPSNGDSTGSMDTTNIMIFFLIATSANQHFKEADTAVAATTGSTTTAGTGTGVGGGGGGSGAF
ncbi:DUF2207 domain-containing protein [Ornithinibacillus contaminans]|uniref:DUF2207 domain-containing protein n=1 Tax=Ornithinibacillus contaminans TaxID=694055 RepID=UPI00064D8ACB|nr:DUF2207 domain-containing protein [Ornithinibacillus contaminans]